MKYIIDYLKGVAIGAGAILPGISSGVLCVIFGIYNHLIDSVFNFFKDIKKNISYLLPIILGIITGVVLFGNVLLYMFHNFPMQTKYSFIGFILGSIPILLKQANKDKGFRLHYLIYLIITFVFTLFLLQVESNLSNQAIFNTLENIDFKFLVLSGFFMSIGVVIPGISSSVILMILGVYEVYLHSISSFNAQILIPMGIGLVVGGLFFLKIIQRLFQKYFSKTYYGIIGFVIGSIFILYPGFEFSLIGFISILCFIISFFIAYYFENKEKQNN